MVQYIFCSDSLPHVCLPDGFQDARQRLDTPIHRTLHRGRRDAEGQEARSQGHLHGGSWG